MATVDLQPITLRDATPTVGEDDFTAAVDQVTFTPEVRWSWAERLGGWDFPVFEGVRWTCVLGFAQDLTEGSLTRYLIEHVAERRTVLFTPEVGGGSAVLAEVMLTPGKVGGDTSGVLISEATMPLFGDPVPGAES